MTEPTAIAQLRHLYQNMVNGAVRDTASAKRIAEGLLAPAIEALKRGTPPAVAGEPVAWESTTPAYTKYVTQSRYEKFSPAVRSWYKPFKCSACAAPPAQQPAQAVPPAGREPLTEVQRSDIATAAAGFNWTDDYVEAIDYVIDGVERHHGIKGGQHGAE